MREFTRKFPVGPTVGSKLFNHEHAPQAGSLHCTPQQCLRGAQGRSASHGKKAQHMMKWRSHVGRQCQVQCVWCEIQYVGGCMVKAAEEPSEWAWAFFWVAERQGQHEVSAGD